MAQQPRDSTGGRASPRGWKHIGIPRIKYPVQRFEHVQDVTIPGIIQSTSAGRNYSWSAGMPRTGMAGWTNSDNRRRTPLSFTPEVIDTQVMKDDMVKPLQIQTNVSRPRTNTPNMLSRAFSEVNGQPIPSEPRLAAICRDVPIDGPYYPPGPRE